MKKKTTQYSILMLVLSLAFVAACSKTSPSSPPTTAVITLSSELSGTITDSTIIGGYDVTVNLPDGVTVESSASGQTNNGVVAASGMGSGATFGATYTPPQGTEKGKVRIMAAKGDGFGEGMFATINAKITSGYCPSISDFPAPTFTVSGFDTNAKSTVIVTGSIKMTESVTMNGTCGGSTGSGSGTNSGTTGGSGNNTGGSGDTNGSGGGTAPAACTYTYSDWGTCDAGTQTRTVVAQSPSGCQGTPVLSQACTVDAGGGDSKY